MAQISSEDVFEFDRLGDIFSVRSPHIKLTIELVKFIQNWNKGEIGVFFI